MLLVLNAHSSAQSSTHGTRRAHYSAHYTCSTRIIQRAQNLLFSVSSLLIRATMHADAHRAHLPTCALRYALLLPTHILVRTPPSMCTMVRTTRHAQTPAHQFLLCALMCAQWCALHQSSAHKASTSHLYALLYDPLRVVWLPLNLIVWVIITKTVTGRWWL